MAKEQLAPADGEYVLDGNHYVARKGEPMPEGAEFVAASAPDDDERAKGAAPENKAKGAAPENRSAH